MLMQPPWFPVRFDQTEATTHFDDLDDTTIHVGDLEVRHESLHRPSGVTVYRLALEGKVVVLATDVESVPWSDERLIDLAEGADVLIYDAQYFPDEYHAAEVGRLVLTSHDPNRTAKGVDEIVATANDHVPTVGASVGLRIEA